MHAIQPLQGMPWRLVIAGCIGMFAASATGSSRAPFLPDLAKDLAVSLPAVANLFAITAVCWGLASYLAGFFSSGKSRRTLMLASPLCLSFLIAAMAFTSSFWILTALVAGAGLCCGLYTTAMLAEVSLRASSTHHGRAFGYVMSGQSLTLLFGVPVAAWLGASIGWRGTHLVLAGLAVFAMLCMKLALREPEDRSTTVRHAEPGKPKVIEIMTPPLVRLFLALIAERVTFGLAAFYYATYLRDAYELPINQVALPLAAFALGNILGTVAGGQVADRYPYRRVSFAIALVLASVAALPWFLWQPALPVTVAFGVTFAFFNALARPPLLAALAEVPENDRSLVMGLNSSVASIGWLTAALVGGWLYAGIGFDGFGVLIAVMGGIGALMVLPDSRIRIVGPAR